MSRVEQLEAALLKAHNAGDKRGAQAIANEIKRVRAADAEQLPASGMGIGDLVRGKTKAPEPTLGTGRVMSTLEGFGTGAANVLAQGFALPWRAAAALGIDFAEDRVRQFDQNLARGEQKTKPYRQAHPNYFTGGEIAGQTLMTAPVTGLAGGALAKGGGALAKVAPKAGGFVQNMGRATTASGFADVGTKARVAGGALSGALTAALTGQDAETGAFFGGALPLGTSFVVTPLGTAIDATIGRVGKTKAAQILRNEIGGRIDEVKAALANAPDDARRNIAEFLAARGIDIPELSALVVDVRKSTSNAPLLKVAKERGDDIAAMQAGLRGGATATEAQTGRVMDKVALNEATAPMREQALGAADVGRRQIAPLEADAARLQQTALDEVERARRYLPMADRMSTKSATGAAEPSLAQVGFLKTPGQLRAGELAGVAEAHGSDAADLSLDAGAGARRAQEMAQNLRDQGLQPLDIGVVVGNLRGKAAEAKNVNPDRYRLLSDAADRLEARAKDFGGIIDAGGLYEFRKNLGANVEGLLGARTGASLKDYTAKLVGDVQPLIDDAIEAAGGKGWKQYINTFAAGMRKQEQDKFATHLADMPEAGMIEVMRGQKPEAVEEFFGPGRFNINAELMGGKLPQAQALANEYRIGQDVTDMGLSGLSPGEVGDYRAGVLARTQQAMAPGLPNKYLNVMARLGAAHTIPHGGSGVGGAQIEQAYANKLYQIVRDRLAQGLASPKEVRMLLDTYSTPQMTRQLMESSPNAMRAAQLYFTPDSNGY